MSEAGRGWTNRDWTGSLTYYLVVYNNYRIHFLGKQEAASRGTYLLLARPALLAFIECTCEEFGASVLCEAILAFFVELGMTIYNTCAAYFCIFLRGQTCFVGSKSCVLDSTRPSLAGLYFWLGTRFPELSLFQPNQRPPLPMSTKSVALQRFDLWVGSPTYFLMSHNMRRPHKSERRPHFLSC
jgi:hypothetical protein